MTEHRDYPREWQDISTAPIDARKIWVSDGTEVWLLTAHRDGSHKRAPRCKFWMDANEPAPPVTQGVRGK
jgi:hypothetical protein